MGHTCIPQSIYWKKKKRHRQQLELLLSPLLPHAHCNNSIGMDFHNYHTLFTTGSLKVSEPSILDVDYSLHWLSTIPLLASECTNTACCCYTCGDLTLQTVTGRLPIGLHAASFLNSHVSWPTPVPVVCPTGPYPCSWNPRYHQMQISYLLP